MISRVFAFSKQVAKKNKLSFPVLELVMSIVVFFIAVWFSIDMGPKAITFLVFSFTAIIIYFSVLTGIRLRNGFKAYATATDGKVYQVVAFNNVAGVNRPGNVLPGELAKYGDLANIAGASMQVLRTKKAVDKMKDPNFIAETIENYQYVRGILVNRIDRVYKIEEFKKAYTILCDYTVLNNGQTYSNKKLKIAKSYTGIEELASELEKIK